MAKFRLSPIEIEAFRWTGDHDQAEDPEWICEALRTGGAIIACQPLRMCLKTPTGWRDAEPGDWIVRNHDGEIYPVKAERLKKFYEAVSESNGRGLTVKKLIEKLQKCNPHRQVRMAMSRHASYFPEVMEVDGDGEVFEDSPESGVILWA